MEESSQVWSEAHANALKMNYAELKMSLGLLQAIGD